MSVWNRTNPSPGLRRRMKAPPQATLSPGRGLWDRVFVLREKKTNAPPCSKSCSWLSAVAGRPLFSSTFPVRSLVFSESAGGRKSGPRRGTRRYFAGCRGTACRPLGWVGLTPSGVGQALPLHVIDAVSRPPGDGIHQRNECIMGVSAHSNDNCMDSAPARTGSK